jgi:hypothetical protein
VDTNVSDECAASIIRVEVTRVRMQSGYIGRLQGGWSLMCGRGERRWSLVQATKDSEQEMQRETAVIRGYNCFVTRGTWDMKFLSLSCKPSSITD